MKVNKNACLRHGCFTYSISLDNNYLSLEPEAAYDAKFAFIQRTADDLSSVIWRAPYSEVICTASHVYKFDERIADGFERQTHIHVFWYSRDYRVGTTGLLANFVGSRKLPGKQNIQ